MSEGFEKTFDAAIHAEMKKVRDNAMVSGMKSVASVVLAKCNQEDKTSDEIVNEIREFCNKGLGNNRKG